ncbi:hypothetical protein EC973_005942 [Apophysomyces ossiformis]|uniref:DUF3752 domain-containing protein n=1 Tax=Apophysomyces ossiformis TaxID=679940 RepID=A0A8H7BW04_9FUNG|nr:hypothetical protein EC973_005942 [Apophysomyces ossiformis]
MIGPEIPAHLLKRKQAIQEDNDNDGGQLEGDVAAENASIGPVIPTELLQKRQKEQSEVVEAVEEDDAAAYAPELPPDLLEARKKTTAEGPRRRRQPVGPSLPSAAAAFDEDEDDIIGPTLPSNYNPEESAVRSVMDDIEQRARRSKEQLENPDNKQQKVERPEWMMLPPEVDYLKHASSGKSRTFSKRQLTEKEQDRSVWTDTPAEKERKLREGATGSQAGVEGRYRAREAEVQEQVQRYNMSQRPESLMEIHKKQKKKDRVEVEDVRKRPFDREKDVLGSYRPMDKRQKKDLLRQSGELGSRFGRGSSSFL